MARQVALPPAKPLQFLLAGPAIVRRATGAKTKKPPSHGRPLQERSLPALLAIVNCLQQQDGPLCHDKDVLATNLAVTKLGSSMGVLPFNGASFENLHGTRIICGDAATGRCQ